MSRLKEKELVKQTLAGSSPFLCRALKSSCLSHPSLPLCSLAPRLQPPSQFPSDVISPFCPFSLRGEVGRAGDQSPFKRQKPGPRSGSALLRSRREQAGPGVQVATGEGMGQVPATG